MSCHPKFTGVIVASKHIGRDDEISTQIPCFQTIDHPPAALEVGNGVIGEIDLGYDQITCQGRKCHVGIVVVNVPLSVDVLNGNQMVAIAGVRRGTGKPGMDTFFTVHDIPDPRGIILGGNASI